MLFAAIHSTGFAQSWELEPAESLIQVEVESTLHDFTAILESFDLSVKLNDNDEVTEAELKFNWHDLDTQKEKRNREMLEWMEASQYPVATFTLKEMVRSDEGLVAHGNFSFHGVSREIQFPVTMSIQDNTTIFKARFDLDYRHWDLEPIRQFLVLTVDPVVTIDVEIKGHLNPPDSS